MSLDGTELSSDGRSEVRGGTISHIIKMCSSHTDLISGDEPRCKRVSVVGILVTQAC